MPHTFFIRRANICFRSSTFFLCSRSAADKPSLSESTRLFAVRKVWDSMPNVEEAFGP